VLSVHVELHYALEEILALLGGGYLTHGAVQELFLVLDYELVALDDGGTNVQRPKLGPYISDLKEMWFYSWFKDMAMRPTKVINGNTLDTKRWPRWRQRMIAIFVRSLMYFTRNPCSITARP